MGLPVFYAGLQVAIVQPHGDTITGVRFGSTFDSLTAVGKSHNRISPRQNRLRAGSVERRCTACQTFAQGADTSVLLAFEARIPVVDALAQRGDGAHRRKMPQSPLCAFQFAAQALDAAL